MTELTLMTSSSLLKISADLKNKTMKKTILVSIFFFSVLHGAYADKIDVPLGKALFQSQCTSCHTIQTVLVGPALRDVFKIRNEAWIIAFVRSSQKMIKGGDTAAVSLFKQFNGTIMPDHPSMSDQDIKNIIGYIKSESSIAISQIPSAAVEEDNDPYKGESGFVRQVVYIDIPGRHLPLLFTDYTAWIVIGGMIFLFLLTLFTIIKAKSLIAFLNNKFDPKNKPT
jgi:cytochrome c2